MFRCDEIRSSAVNLHLNGTKKLVLRFALPIETMRRATYMIPIKYHQ